MKDLIIILSVAYFIQLFFFFFSFAITEGENIDSKREFVSWLIPFYWVVIFYKSIKKSFNELD